MSKQQNTLLRAIRSFSEKYGAAYPSIAMLAKCTGLTELEVVATIKELEKIGKITKKARYDANGRRRSNEYTIIESPIDEKPQNIEPPADEKTLDNKDENGYPLKSFIKSFKIFKKEDELNNKQPKLLSHDNHIKFFYIMHKYKLTHELSLYLFDDPHIRETLGNCKEWHIHDAVDELQYRLSIRHQIYSLRRWFNQVLESCRIKDIGMKGGYTA